MTANSWLLLASVVCTFACSAPQQLAERPNIVLMMADDMGMGDTSAYQDVTGNADDVQVHTPGMERLASMGVRFTDAHTPSSRCSPTRYSLLTGRYAWRSRLKHWVLYGSQGDPMIEAGRPTIASMLRSRGYRTGMYGKWHVGLRYTRSDGSPAAGWEDADLTQPLHTSPLDHGFDEARFTSRSHGTSGPHAPEESSGRGPGHVHGRTVAAATGRGKEIAATGPDAYLLHRLGSRHSDHAIGFLTRHIEDPDTRLRPFFLYYPSNANHGPYTPDAAIGGRPVAGASRTKAGGKMDARHDYVYENDVALGRLLDWLEGTDDPREKGRKLVETTLVIFTSDNGAEKDSNIATGPFRSNKGSAYEGGHRVPFIVSWPQGGVGDGDPTDPGLTNRSPISLTDMYATFAEIAGASLPDLKAGERGAEDSFSVLRTLRGQEVTARPPLFFNDHKESQPDPAVVAMRLDSPTVGGTTYRGKWKLFFEPALLRTGEAKPYELYDLEQDPMEQSNRISERSLEPLVRHMTARALLHRTAGGHRLAALASDWRATFDWTKGELAGGGDPKLSISPAGNGRLVRSEAGLGIAGGQSDAVDGGEAILVSFDADVIIESAAIAAGDGSVGGFYRVSSHSPLAIYCVDGDIDDRDQSGVLSDIGVLRRGEQLRLDSSPHFGNEAEGQWWLERLSVRPMK